MGCSSSSSSCRNDICPFPHASCTVPVNHYSMCCKLTCSSLCLPLPHSPPRHPTPRSLEDSAEGSKLTPQVFGRWYRPPELLMGCNDYGTAVDMWAAGCVLGELLLRRPWFPGVCDMDQLDRIFRVSGQALWLRYHSSVCDTLTADGVDCAVHPCMISISPCCLVHVLETILWLMLDSYSWLHLVGCTLSCLLCALREALISGFPGEHSKCTTTFCTPAGQFCGLTIFIGPVLP